MKRVLIFLLIISVGINVIFLQKKVKRYHRGVEVNKLHFYKKIPYEDGYASFKDQFKKRYPQTTLNNKYFIVYRWDSLHYDFIYRDQMKALDSMAAVYGKYKLEYVFVTEMEEGASKRFLKASYDDYKHVKMLYGMDDYISGLHNNKDFKMNKPMVIHRNKSKHKKENDNNASVDPWKQTNLYLIMDAGGKVLFTNKNMISVLKDTAFLNSLNTLLPTTNVKILN